MPSYIKREIESLLATKTYNKTTRTQRRNRRLGLFSKSTDRVYEKEPLDSRAGTKALSNNSTFLNSSWADVSADFAGGTNYTQNSTDASSDYYIEDWYDYEPAYDEGSDCFEEYGCDNSTIVECDFQTDPYCD